MMQCDVLAASGEECLLSAIYTFSSVALPETLNTAQLSCVHGLVSAGDITDSFYVWLWLGLSTFVCRKCVLLVIAHLCIFCSVLHRHSLLHFYVSHMAVHHLHHLHYHRLHLLLLAQYFILNWRLGSSANPFLHRPFPFLPDWLHRLSDHLMTLLCSTAGFVCIVC